MDINNYRIIQGLIVTSKSKKAFDSGKKITLQVDTRANKSEIKHAVETVWSVKVKQVRTISIPATSKKFSGRPFKTSAYKKAIIDLKEGYSIDLPWQQGLSSVDQAKNTSGEGE
jgi:large subunit ribosomal protein L23